ncbi:MAG: PD40 domain-containing protein [Gemmatimonadetes bacterium]|nr:PD40 domain-containing protein [Gemmatimonadota bacterium]
MSATSFVRSLSSLAVLVGILFVPTEGAADPIKFMRDPHIANGMIVFSYHGDIWIARQDGTQPRRLTYHVAREIAPRFSPDGRWVAFTSNRFGNNDVFLVPVSGGEPTQLTFHSGNDLVAGWTPNGEHIMFVTSRGTHPFYSPMYTVAVTGGIPTPMEMDQARNAMINQDGTMMAFNRNPLSTSRKGQKGNRTTNIFVQDLATKAITQLTDTDIQGFRNHTHDAIPMWGRDGMIYFASERDGIFNIWKIAPEGGAPMQVTRHSRGGVKYPSISPDGGTIIYTNDHELWTLDVPDGQPQKITVDLSFDPTTSLVEYVNVENRADGISPSANGDFLVVDYRGEVFIVPTDDDVGEKTQVTRSPWRERYASYSPDGSHLAYVSDEGLEEELWVYNLEDGSRKKLSTHESQKTGNYTWSPEGDRIAYVAANRLFEVNIESGRTTELGYNQERGFNLAQYSPDGNWILYDRRDANLGWQVYLMEISNRQEHDLTQHQFRNWVGRLTPDGKTLVFLSTRDNGTTHLFKTALARHTEDPDDPLVKARRNREDTEEAEEAEPEGLTVNVDGIEHRAVQLTRGENGVQSYFLSADGETAYFTSRDEDGPALFSIGLDGEDQKKVASGTFTQIMPTKDGKSAFYYQNREGNSFEVHKVSLPSGKKEQVRFSFRVQVDHRAEWEQIFEESWRVMKYRFYDENMHGKDWDAIKAAYKPLLPHVGTYEDLYDLANQMIGELNASHVGVRGAPSRPMDNQYQTKFLGVELEPADGRYRVTHVYRDGPADKEWLDIEAGDYVLAIDGQEVRAGENYWNALNHALNEYVPIQVADSPNGDNSRELRIKTVTSMRNIRYEEWVADNRDFVERESDGKIAYVHIRAMNRPSLARFENEIDEFWNAEGIVVDIRYNGGGNIDQQLLDILERRPYEYWNNRWASRATGRRPRQAIAGPKVMLINHRSGSDSEVTPKGFRDLELGRIVGNPTAAAVIATGSYRLIHGGTIRTPGSLVVAYDPTKPNNYGVNLENYGVGPDVWAVNTPEDELAGFDRELKAAVDEALRMLAEGKWRFTAEDSQENGNSGR